jgi:tetratricopeptide (TPR) repeat protein
MTGKVLKLQNYETPEAPGLHFRLLCMTGKNKGISYFIVSKRAVMGRGETADIQVLDIKSSREHAEITIAGDDVFITDLGSQNGLVVNDLKIKQHKLKDGDRVFIGQTVYKFGKVEVKGAIKAINEDDDLEDFDGEEPGKSNLPLILVAVALIGAFLFLSEDENTSIKKSPKNETNSYRNSQIGDEFAEALIRKKHSKDKELKEKLNIIFQRGLREYREGNYFRAMSEFNLALYLSPNDPLATFYMNKTKDALDVRVKSYALSAARDIESLKYRSALTQYCSIIRLLQNYQTDQRYKDAEKNIYEMEGKLGMDKGEAQCIKK